MVKHKSLFSFRLPVFILLFLVILSTVMLSLSTGGFLVDFKQLGFSILSSVQKGVYSITSKVTGTVTAIKEISVLREEYALLTEKLKDYQYLQRNNAEINKENERLKEQLGFSLTLQQKNYPALVIGRDPNNLYSAITINKGSRHGIRKNMPVIAIQNGTVGLVGKVISVGFTTSMIMPVYDFQCNISARIQNTRDVGIISGGGSADVALSMKYIKKRVLEELQFGDVVVTSGENDNYIRDIPVGSISKISVLDYDTSLDIEITPIIDFSRLETVIVIDMHEKNDSQFSENKES